jgi:hypothetical protein
MYRKQDGSIHTLVEGEKSDWHLSIYNNYLYFTNSRNNEVTAIYMILLWIK